MLNVIQRRKDKIKVHEHESILTKKKKNLDKTRLESNKDQRVNLSAFQREEDIKRDCGL